jgi:diphthamide biosynthesis methyltransferase
MALPLFDRDTHPPARAQGRAVASPAGLRSGREDNSDGILEHLEEKHIALTVLRGDGLGATTH